THLIFMKHLIAFFIPFILLSPRIESQQTANLSGKITNARSAPVPGSTVYLLNTNQGAVADENGNFSLHNLPAGKYVIHVSAIGYAAIYKDVVVGISANESLNIQLTDAGLQLDAVLVNA